MDGKTVGCLLFIGLAIIAGFLLLGGNTANTLVVLQELTEGEPFALFMVNQLPEELRKEHPYALEAKMFNLKTNQCLPRDCSPALLEATSGEMAEAGGNQMVAAGIISRAFQPQVGTMESGGKVYVLPIGIRGVTDMGTEVGNIIFDPDYDADFKPFADPINLWNVPNCIVRTLKAGGSFQDMECLQAGYMPTDNYIRQGPTRVGSGLFVCLAYATGVWCHDMDIQMLSNILNSSPVATQWYHSKSPTLVQP
jgi:hypothetical protein